MYALVCFAIIMYINFMVDLFIETFCIGSWILLQVANGTGYLGGSEASGIAYAAHIGGFIAGLLLIKKFLPSR